jgi:hypothetical protein
LVAYLTIQIVHLEQKLDLVIRGLTSELVHRVDKFLQRNGTRVVLVEDLEHSLCEERLEMGQNNCMINGTALVSFRIRGTGRTELVPKSLFHYSEHGNKDSSRLLDT